MRRGLPNPWLQLSHSQGGSPTIWSGQSQGRGLDQGGPQTGRLSDAGHHCCAGLAWCRAPCPRRTAAPAAPALVAPRGSGSRQMVLKRRPLPCSGQGLLSRMSTRKGLISLEGRRGWGRMLSSFEAPAATVPSMWTPGQERGGRDSSPAQFQRKGEGLTG